MGSQVVPQDDPSQQINNNWQENIASILAGIARALLRPIGFVLKNPVKIFRPKKIGVSTVVLIAMLIDQPLDIIKQAYPPHIEKEKPKAHKLIKSLLQTQGFKGVTLVVGPPLVINAVLGSMTFGIYHAVLRKLDKKLSPVNYITAGCAAGFAHAMLACPVDNVKFSLVHLMGSLHSLEHKQMEVPHHHKHIHIDSLRIPTWTECYEHVKLQRGLIKGLYNGLPLTIMRDTLTFGIFFGVYKSCKSAIVKRVGHSKPKEALAAVVAGGAAGVSAHVISTPFDVVRNHMSELKVMEGQPHTIAAAWNSFKTIWSTAPRASFLFGLNRGLIKAFPAAALGFLVFEMVDDSH